VLTDDEVIGIQAEKHVLIETELFYSEQDFVLHQIHNFAYVCANALSTGRTVLDFGCNTGYGSDLMAVSASQVTGVDVAERAIAIAQQKYHRDNLRFKLVDGKSLPFSDGSFDVVVSFQVIEHIARLDSYFEELRRVLRPDGLLFLTTPNSQLRLDPGMAPVNPFHVREFDSAELKQTLEQYFPAVGIYGVFASAETYQVEFDRLQAGLLAARRQSRLARRVRRLIQQKVPQQLVDRWKRFLRIVASNETAHGVEIGAAVREKHPLDNFWYSKQDLSRALDLAAVCTADEGKLPIAEKELTRRSSVESTK